MYGEIHDVRIEKRWSNAWGVVGKVANTGKYSRRGAAQIDFINSKGEVVKTISAKVTGIFFGPELEPGEWLPFEYWTDPDDFDDVKVRDMKFRWRDF